MPGCGEEDECLGRGGSLEDGDLYLCWNNCPGLAVVTCHHFTSIHRKLSQLEGIQFHSGKVDIHLCQRVILQSGSGRPGLGHFQGWGSITGIYVRISSRLCRKESLMSWLQFLLTLHLPALVTDPE